MYYKKDGENVNSKKILCTSILVSFKPEYHPAGLHVCPVSTPEKCWELLTIYMYHFYSPITKVFIVFIQADLHKILQN